MSGAETPFEEKYPEHMKLDAVKDRSQAVGEFLDSGGYILATETNGDDCWFDCREDHPHLRATSKPITQILAEYYGIDLNTIEKEKREMLAELREES
jgi:hypothetical protein